MKADAILKMIEYAFHPRYFIIDFIKRENVSTMQAGLKHTPRDYRVQVLESPKGDLDDEVPVLTLLTYPSQ